MTHQVQTVLFLAGIAASLFTMGAAIAPKGLAGILCGFVSFMFGAVILLSAAEVLIR